MNRVLYLVLLGLGAHHLWFGGGGGLPLSQAVLFVHQPALELLCALPGLLPQLQRGLLAVETFSQLPAQRLVSAVHVRHGHLELCQVYGHDGRKRGKLLSTERNELEIYYNLVK